MNNEEKNENGRLKEQAERMRILIEPVVRGMGYDTLELTVEGFKTLGMRWSKSDKNMVIGVSDYLIPAPDDILTDILTSMVRMIDTGGRIRFSEKALEWLNSDSFREQNRMKYLMRWDFDPEVGTGKIIGSILRLRSMGLDKGVEKMFIGWSGMRLGLGDEISRLMKTCLLSRNLMEDDIPDVLFDFIIYRAIFLMREEFSNEMDDVMETEEILQHYPLKSEVERKMTELGYAF